MSAAGTAEVGTGSVKARKVQAHTTPRALVECAGLAVAVPRFASAPEDAARAEPRAAAPRAVFEFGPLRMVLGWLGDVRTGRRVAVTQVQMRILRVLVAAGGSAVHQDELMRGRTWGGRETQRTASVHITALRHKFREIRTEATIRSHPRVGYSIVYPGIGVVGAADGARDTGGEAIQKPESRIQNAQGAAQGAAQEAAQGAAQEAAQEAA